MNNTNVDIINYIPELKEERYDTEDDSFSLKFEKKDNSSYNMPIVFLSKINRLSLFQEKNNFKLFGNYSKINLLHHSFNSIRMSIFFKNYDLKTINLTKKRDVQESIKNLIQEQLRRSLPICKKIPFLQMTRMPKLTASYLVSSDMAYFKKAFRKIYIKNPSSLCISYDNNKIVWNVLELQNDYYCFRSLPIPNSLSVPHKHYPFSISIDSEFVDKKKDGSNIFENERTNIPLAVGVKINYFSDLHQTHYKTYIFDLNHYNILKSKSTNNFLKDSLEYIEYRPSKEYDVKSKIVRMYVIIEDDNIFKRVIEREILSQYFRPNTEKGTLYFVDHDMKYLLDNFSIYSIPILFYFSLKDLKYFLGSEIYKHVEPYIFTQRNSSFERHSTISPFYFIYVNEDIKIIFKIKLIDLFGLNSKGLLALSNTVNVKMNNKEALNEYKADMREAIKHKADVFLDYLYEDTSSLLPIYASFNAYVSKLYNLFKIPYIPNIFSDYKNNELKLTLGSVVANLFESYIYNIDFNLENTLDLLSIKIKRTDMEYKNIKLVDGLEMGSSKYLHFLKGSSIEGAFVSGGRCCNETPNERFFEYGGDIDFSSCYGSGIKDLSYPIGVPRVLRNENGGFVYNLRTFLKKYRSDLCKGCWYIVVSTKKDEELSFDIDLFVSKIISSKNITEKMKNPENMTHNVHLSGDQVVLRRQLRHCIIVHETLEMIKKIATNKEKRELYDKLQVVTAVFYPKRYQCKDSKEFIYKVNDYYLKRNKQKKEDSTDDSRKSDKPNFWFGIPMEGFVGTLIEERKKYKKLAYETNEKEYDSLQFFYKTVVNTVYGVTASRFFKVCNLCFANNITGKARSSVWFLSKSFNLKNTLTDGGMLEVNKIFMPWHKSEKRPGFHQLYNIHISKEKKDELYFKPFGYDPRTKEAPNWNEKFENVRKMPETTSFGEIESALNKLANEHFKKMYDFYKLRNCLIYDLEFKPDRFFIRASTAQRAHYYIFTVHGKEVYKIRGTQMGYDDSIASPIIAMLKYKAFADQNNVMVFNNIFYSQRNLLKKHDLPKMKKKLSRRFLNDDFSLHCSFISRRTFFISYDTGNYRDYITYKNMKGKRTELKSYEYLSKNCILQADKEFLKLKNDVWWEIYDKNLNAINSENDKKKRFSKKDREALNELYGKVYDIDPNGKIEMYDSSDKHKKVSEPSNGNFEESYQEESYSEHKPFLENEYSLNALDMQEEEEIETEENETDLFF